MYAYIKLVYLYVSYTQVYLRVISFQAQWLNILLELFHSRLQSRAWRFARGHATCGWGTSCWDPNIPLGGAFWPLPLCDIDIDKRASTARTVWIVFTFVLIDRHSWSSERRAQISLRFLRIYLDIFVDFLQLLSGHFRLYKNNLWTL